MSLKRNQTGFKHVIAPFFRALVAFVLVVGLLPTMVFTFVEPAEALALTDAPSYYRPLMDGGSPVQDDAGNPVYYYDEVVGSSGVLDTRYRVYDKDDEEWYPCDATGTPTGGGALTLADFATERPQPGYWVNTATTTPAQRYVNLTRAAMSGEQVLKATNITGNFVEQTGYPVSSGANRNVAYGSIYPGALIEYDFVGKYRFNYAASANGFSAGGNMMQDGFLRDERVPGDIPFIEDTRYGCGLTTTSAGGLNAVKA
ncbi:MAG: hypothetical protein FWG24_06650, partial [Eggerthellaceae bacterium]|nr:hypothetical protein [Eggerthellaceae bacterium]